MNPINHGHPLQLAFSYDGILYGHNSNDGWFYEVDTGTGVLTKLSQDENKLYTDLASNPPQPKIPPPKNPPPPDEAVGGEVYPLDKLAMMVRLGGLGLFLIILKLRISPVKYSLQ